MAVPGHVLRDMPSAIRFVRSDVRSEFTRERQHRADPKLAATDDHGCAAYLDLVDLRRVAAHARTTRRPPQLRARSMQTRRRLRILP